MMSNRDSEHCGIEGEFKTDVIARLETMSSADTSENAVKRFRHLLSSG